MRPALGACARRTEPAAHATPTFTAITVTVRIAPSRAICQGTAAPCAVTN
jgi:hypothetical protein